MYKYKRIVYLLLFILITVLLVGCTEEYDDKSYYTFTDIVDGVIIDDTGEAGLIFIKLQNDNNKLFFIEDTSNPKKIITSLFGEKFTNFESLEGHIVEIKAKRGVSDGEALPVYQIVKIEVQSVIETTPLPVIELP